MKHITHIKELLRVAKEREATIEREHMVIEMKKLRYLSICAYIHTYIYTYIHIYIHTYCTYIHTYCTYMQPYIHAHAYIYTSIYIDANIPSFLHIYIQRGAKHTDIFLKCGGASSSGINSSCSYQASRRVCVYVCIV